jgi:hypothetical protein
VIRSAAVSGDWERNFGFIADESLPLTAVLGKVWYKTCRKKPIILKNAGITHLFLSILSRRPVLGSFLRQKEPFFLLGSPIVARSKQYQDLVDNS